MNSELILSEETISNNIYYIRNQKVMLDRDLAALYGIETRVLKQAVRRNISRFPEDFMFELSKTEYDSLRSQIVTLKKGRGAHQKYLPFAFTEHGILMLSSVLNSEKAIQTNIQIMCPDSYRDYQSKTNASGHYRNEIGYCSNSEKTGKSK
ncbi:MAG TPA: ORF6N domain-containing protein [Flavobacterium sp.]|nr:ORF6N domain-containing protein [Flavobacterium sp.]